MTTELRAPASRPTGPGHARLLAAELRRLWWRRLTRGTLAIAILFTGATLVDAYQSTGSANRTEQIAAYEQATAEFPQMVRGCERAEAEARDRGEEGSFGCAGMTAPSPADFGITAPDPGLLFGQLGRTNAFLYAFLALVLGASLVGAEYSAGSLGTWLTFEPRRVRVASSKLVAAGIGGAAISAAGLAVTAVGAWLVIQVNRPDPGIEVPGVPGLDDPAIHVVLRVLAAGALAAVTGAVLALLARNTGAVVAVVLGYVVVVEGILASMLAQGRLAPWLPVRNLQAFVDRGASYYAEVCGSDGVCQYTSLPIGYTHGWVYLLVAGSLLVALGLLVLRRRDLA